MSEGQDREQTEQLHARASEHYLAGEFRRALKAWETLLDLDPADRRAQEGVRLCRLMADAEPREPESGDEPATPPPPSAPREPGAPAREALDFDLDLSKIGEDELKPAREEAAASAAPEIDDLIDEHLSVLDAAPPAGAEGTAPRALDAERQGDGLDLGDLSATEAIPLGDKEADDWRGAAAAETAAAGALPLDEALLDPGASSDGEPGAEAAGPSAVARELQHRVGELLVEARAAAAAGRTEEALALVDRVSILDEDNAAAQALREELRGAAGPSSAELEDWMNQAVQLFHHGKPDEARELLVRVLDAVPGHREAQHLMAQLEVPGSVPGVSVPPAPAAPGRATPEGLADAGDAPGDIPLGAPVPVQPAADDVAEDAEAAPAAKAGRRRLVLALAAVAALAVLALGAGWLLPRLLGGGAPAGDTPAGAAARPPEGAKRRPGTDPAAAKAPADPRATDAAAPAAAADLPALIESARRHFESGDYAAAVVAYNRVLAVDPKNNEAHHGLREAGDRYRAQQETTEQLETARREFEDMSYANALRLLYRMPDSVDRELVRGAIVNGWYNLGVQELKAGDPREAIEHFDEALAIRGDDQGVLRARALAERFLDRARDSEYYRTVETLAFRGME